MECFFFKLRLLLLGESWLGTFAMTDNDTDILLFSRDLFTCRELWKRMADASNAFHLSSRISLFRREFIGICFNRVQKGDCRISCCWRSYGVDVSSKNVGCKWTLRFWVCISIIMVASSWNRGDSEKLSNILNFYLSMGYTLAAFEPLITFSIFVDRIKPFLYSLSTQNVVILAPRLVTIYVSHFLLLAVFNWPWEIKLKGCIRCGVWDGNVMTWIKLPLQKIFAEKLV